MREAIDRAEAGDTGSGSGSLADVISAIEEGGTILFAPTITAVTLDSSAEITLNKAVTINGGENGVTITGNGKRLFAVSAGTNDFPVEPTGATLSSGNGTGTNTEDNGKGGAILVKSGKALKITNCTVTSNTAADYGGAVYLGTGAELTVVGTQFESNTATSKNGGAIFAAEDSTATIADATFTGNSAKNGEALCVYGTVTLGSANVADKVVFGSETETEKNSATVNRGAIFGYGAIMATNVEFLNNSAGKAGGALYNATRGNIIGNVTLADTAFRGNKADSKTTTEVGYGGAIYNLGMIHGTNVTFTENEAKCFGGAYMGCGEGEFANSTFTGNSAQTGGAVYCDDYTGDSLSGMTTLTNCVFSANSALSSDQTDYTTGYGNGGAISNWSTLNLIGGTFGGENASDGNSAEFHGGAIFNNGTLNLYGDQTAHLFSGNSAYKYGGAILSTGSVIFRDELHVNTNKSVFSGNRLKYNYGTSESVDYRGLDFTNGNGNLTVSASDISMASDTEARRYYLTITGQKRVSNRRRRSR